MDTTSKDLTGQLKKVAGGGNSISSAAGALSSLVALPKETLKMYLATAAALGLAGGAGLGAISSYVKSKNPKLVTLARKKDFYDKKVREMDNENWLNEVMTAKKKLETSKLSDEERTELEDKYMKLINNK